MGFWLKLYKRKFMQSFHSDRSAKTVTGNIIFFLKNNSSAMFQRNV